MPTKMESNKAHIIRQVGSLGEFVRGVDHFRFYEPSNRHHNIETAVRQYVKEGNILVWYDDQVKYMKRIYGKGTSRDYERVMTQAGVSLYNSYRKRHPLKK